MLSWADCHGQGLEVPVIQPRGGEGVVVHLSGNVLVITLPSA